jgi:hypothetical protein
MLITLLCSLDQLVIFIQPAWHSFTLLNVKIH